MEVIKREGEKIAASAEPADRVKLSRQLSLLDSRWEALLSRAEARYCRFPCGAAAVHSGLGLGQHFLQVRVLYVCISIMCTGVAVPDPSFFCCRVATSYIPAYYESISLAGNAFICVLHSPSLPTMSQAQAHAGFCGSWVTSTPQIGADQ